MASACAFELRPSFLDIGLDLALGKGLSICLGSQGNGTVPSTFEKTKKNEFKANVLGFTDPLVTTLSLASLSLRHGFRK